MSLNIKNAAVERLAAEVAALAGETKTEAIRRALLERKRQLAQTEATAAPVLAFQAFLEREIWPIIPADQVGRRLTRSEEDEILGYDEHGA